METQKSQDNISLLNFAVKETIDNGGEVFLLEEEQMPEEGAVVNALLRYSANER